VEIAGACPGQAIEVPMSRDGSPRPLLSVVVPTRNRVPYAQSAIESILAIDDRRLELVVQDNGDTAELESWVMARRPDSRFRYNHTAEPLAFVHNFDRAAAMATGDYVCFIGDDDGVNPEILEAAAWAKGMQLDALAIRPSAHYLWPGAALPATLFTPPADGVLSLTRYGSSVRFADPEAEVVALMRNGGLYYLDTDLPKLYHGLVHRRCLEAIHARVGAFFGGLSPDTFASLAVACVAVTVAVVDYPLTIPGSCPVSGSFVEGVLKTHSKALEDAPHLRHRGDYRWCALVPRLYTAETLWVDSSVAALGAMGRDDLVRELNVPRLAALSIWANRGVTKVVLPALLDALREKGENCLVGLLRFALSLLRLFGGSALRTCRRVWNRLLMIAGVRRVRRVEGVKNMVDASRELVRDLRANGRAFADIVRGVSTQPRTARRRSGHGEG
jgi:hypothetical protein